MVSLVIVSLLGSFPSSGSSTKEQQSKSYWSGTTPFAISTSKVSASTISLSVSNKLTERVYLTAIEVQDGFGNTGTIMTPNQVFNAGEEIILSNISFSRNNPCNGKAVGSMYEFKVVAFVYTQGSIASIRQQGVQPLVGKCGVDTVTFTYRGIQVTYGVVLSQADRYWLDRNLGASQVATAYNDAAAYGDLFQWGRLDDGHQNRTSATTATLSVTNNPGHSNFIIAPNSPYDWRATQNDSLWQGAGGINNPCPLGWRLPTITEWQAEITAGSWTNRDGAYASSLKLPATGRRSSSDGTLDYAGSDGNYWGSSVSGTSAAYLFFGTSAANTGYHNRARSKSVRCIRD
jgi:uncharacterized protein (TIGR02145 family)